MKKIFKLTTFSFVGPFIATFFVVLFILVIQFLWKYIDDLVGKGLEWYVIMQLLFYASATFVPLALPLSILLSSIMSFGKLAETYELVALKSAGVSLLRIMVPLITVVSALSVGAFFFSNNMIPKANLKYFSLLWDVTHKRPALNIPENVFYNEIENYSIRVNKKDKTSKKIEGITIYDHTRPGNDIVITAQRGEMETTRNNQWMILKLFDGHRFEEMPPQNKGNDAPTYPASRLSFESYEMKFDLSVFELTRTREDLFKEHHQMMKITQLRMYEDSLKKVMKNKREDVKDFTKPYFQLLRDTSYFMRNKNTAFEKLPESRTYIQAIPLVQRRVVIFRALSTARTLSEVLRVQAEELDNYQKQVWRYQMEQHRKYAIAITCLTLFFIGAPLGAIIRKGGLGMPTVASIILFIILYILNIFGERSAKEGGLSPFMGMWLSTIILMPIGFYLTYRANIDKISFNFDWFSRMTGRIKKLFTRKRRHADPPAL